MKVVIIIDMTVVLGAVPSRYRAMFFGQALYCRTKVNEHSITSHGPLSAPTAVRVRLSVNRLVQ